MELLKKEYSKNFNIDNFIATKKIKIDLDNSEDRLVTSFEFVQIPIGEYIFV